MDDVKEPTAEELDNQRHGKWMWTIAKGVALGMIGYDILEATTDAIWRML